MLRPHDGDVAEGVVMNAADILVVIVAVAALAGLGWFFFGPRKATAAVLAGGGSGWRSRSGADTVPR